MAKNIHRHIFASASGLGLTLRGLGSRVVKQRCNKNQALSTILYELASNPYFRNNQVTIDFKQANVAVQKQSFSAIMAQ